MVTCSEIMGTPTAQQLYAMNPYYDAGGKVAREDEDVLRFARVFIMTWPVQSAIMASSPQI